MLPNFAPLGSLGARPDGAQSQFDSSVQLCWVDGEELIFEMLGHGVLKDAEVKQPLVGGPGRVVDLAHPGPTALLAHELASRAQESVGYRAKVSVNVLAADTSFTLDVLVQRQGGVLTAVTYSGFGDPNEDEERDVGRSSGTAKRHDGRAVEDGVLRREIAVEGGDPGHLSAAALDEAGGCADCSAGLDPFVDD